MRVSFALKRAVGGRGGWRLPAFNELASLVDPAVTDPTVLRLTAGHPFLDIQPAAYWSSTVFVDQPGFGLIVNFVVISGSDAPIAVFDANATGGLYLFWAVRGGSPGPHNY